MFRFTIRDVLWLMVMVGLACGFGCSHNLEDSAAGRRLIKQIQSANSVTIKPHIAGDERAFSITPDAKNQLVAWMKKATRDPSPKKYEVLATIEVRPTGDWFVLQISSVEVGLCIDMDNYWRGLDRTEFERIVRSSPATN